MIAASFLLYVGRYQCLVTEVLHGICSPPRIAFILKLSGCPCDVLTAMKAMRGGNRCEMLTPHNHSIQPRIILFCLWRLNGWLWGVTSGWTGTFTAYSLTLNVYCHVVFTDVVTYTFNCQRISREGSWTANHTTDVVDNIYTNNVNDKVVWISVQDMMLHGSMRLNVHNLTI